MLGKGKGFVLGKLRIITLIEADWQYIMRMYLGDGKEEIIENVFDFLVGLFDEEKPFTKSDLNMITEIYKLFEKSYI